MEKIRFLLMILLLIWCSREQAMSQSLSIETDPSTFLLKGYSIHLRYQPAEWHRTLIGVGSYGMKMPDPFVDLNKSNANEGWNVRIRSAFSIFGEYYFREVNKRWFVGEQLGVQNFRVTNAKESFGSENRFRNLLALTYLGYSWHPWKKDFYVKPWAGLGYTRKVDGSSGAYDVAPIFPFVTFHIGYTFGNNGF